MTTYWFSFHFNLRYTSYHKNKHTRKYNFPLHRHYIYACKVIICMPTCFAWALLVYTLHQYTGIIVQISTKQILRYFRLNIFHLTFKLHLQIPSRHVQYGFQHCFICNLDPCQRKVKKKKIKLNSFAMGAYCVFMTSFAMAAFNSYVYPPTCSTINLPGQKMPMSWPIQLRKPTSTI